MADALVGFQEGMALIPDNVAQLVSPEDVRRVQLSFLQDRGQTYAVGSYTISTPDDVWVDIPTQVPIGDRVLGDGLFWRLDGNGHLVYDYAADWPTVEVPPGYIRQVQCLSVVVFDPSDDAFEFAVTIGGVIQPPTVIVEPANQTDSVTVPIISGDPIDVSAAPPVSISVRSLTGNNTITLTTYALRTIGGPSL